MKKQSVRSLALTVLCAMFGASMLGADVSGDSHSLTFSPIGVAHADDGKGHGEHGDKAGKPCPEKGGGDKGHDGKDHGDKDQHDKCHDEKGGKDDGHHEAGKGK